MGNFVTRSVGLVWAVLLLSACTVEPSIEAHDATTVAEQSTTSASHATTTDGVPDHTERQVAMVDIAYRWIEAWMAGDGSLVVSFMTDAGV